MKILFLLPAAEGVYPKEAEQRRMALIESYASRSTQIHVGFLEQHSGFVPYFSGTRQELTAEHEARTHELAAERATQAAVDGYDAFCPFGALDVGVRLARKRGVGLYCVGPGEASLLTCRLLGRPFATCYYTSDQRSTHRDLIAAYGLSELHVASTAIGLGNAAYPERREEILERYVRCANTAKEAGAELMGLIGMSVCPTEFSAAELSEATDLPAMDGLAAQVGLAEFAGRTRISIEALNRTLGFDGDE